MVIQKQRQRQREKENYRFAAQNMEVYFEAKSEEEARKAAISYFNKWERKKRFDERPVLGVLSRYVEEEGQYSETIEVFPID